MQFSLKNFYLGIIVDLQKSCKYNKVPIFLDSPNVGILHNHCIYVKTKKSILVHYY